jgi:hypothetical protein
VDVQTDIEAAEDRGEPVALMEPLLLGEGSRHRAELTDLALELAQRSAGFRRSLPESLLASLASLVRSMNCYYSNLIEGHDTHPIDIERALQGDYSRDLKKRDLQFEAKAHIAVQQWIDEGGIRGRAVTAESIREIHRRFCEALPEDLLWTEDPTTHERMKVVPGALRTRDVAVGNHIPVSAPAVPRFLSRFEEVYSRLGKTETILATAAAHHRLARIHPFLDGNGRVAMDAGTFPRSYWIRTRHTDGVSGNRFSENPRPSRFAGSGSRSCAAKLHPWRTVRHPTFITGKGWTGTVGRHGSVNETTSGQRGCAGLFGSGLGDARPVSRASPGGSTGCSCRSPVLQARRSYRRLCHHRLGSS